MAYENLKNAIRQVIKQNGNQEITGSILQSTLINIINTIGSEYKFLGFAKLSTIPPASIDESKLFYFASEAGEYNNFLTSAENTWIVIGEGLHIFTKQGNNSFWKAECLIDIKQEFGNSENSTLSQKFITKKIKELYPVDDIYDFSLSDEKGNRIGIFEGGHFRTKNFNSKETAKSSDIKVGTKEITNADYEISDEKGNRIGIFEGGHFRTKNFNSRNINSGSSTHPVYKPRNNETQGKDVFSFEVNINIPVLDTDSAIGDNYITGTDHGYIILPTSYSESEEPTRLIITCHGASATLDTYTNTGGGLPYPWSYLVKSGYAIMDVYGLPYEVSNLIGTHSEEHFGAPVTLQCYKQGYDYVMKNYNLKRDGIFVTGASMGGISSFQIVQSGMFPVLAQTGFCPCIDLFKQSYCHTWESPSFQRARLAKYFGFTGAEPTWTNTQSVPSAEEIKYFKDNFDKVIGSYPILKNVMHGDIKTVFDYIPTEGGINNTPQEEQAIYDKFISFHPCPIKIFHNLNDGTVPFRYSKYFIEMVKRGGQLAFLRSFSTGGHNAWANGVSKNITDVDGNSFSITASQYECLLFFNRFN